MRLSYSSRSAKSRPAVRPAVDFLDVRVVPSTLSVGDTTIIEGNADTRYALVSVTLNVPNKQAVTVNYKTVAGTARAGVDYGSVSGKLTFARGETIKTIAIPVHGDRAAEADESFTVRLSGARGAWIGDSQAVVTIVEDEPRLSIGDAAGTVYSLWDGTVQPATLRFTVSLAVAYDQAVSVDFATADGTARAGVDYLARSGTLTFAPGETTKEIEVVAMGPFTQFYINLSRASSNARILDVQGVGSINGYYEQPSPDPGDGCNADHPYWPNC
ncbi:MAG: Calx-beta domain-containing protein [Isosphaeraceae bacterium]